MPVMIHRDSTRCGHGLPTGGLETDDSADADSCTSPQDTDKRPQDELLGGGMLLQFRESTEPLDRKDHR